MPFTLYRHLLVEVLKVFLLTTAVIVVVIAFGAAIKPLAANLLGPGGIAKYIALATVPMLQFAVPFAGGFAATIVFHRFATDNEITAMACCGLSYRKILVPVAALGVLLLGFMFVIVNFAVPQFWTLLNLMVTKDATAVFAAAVQRGEALPVGRLSIYADGLRDVPLRPDEGVEKRLVLLGVAAIESGEDGHPVTEFASESATVDLYRRGRQTWMKMAMSNATVFRADEGTVVVVPRALPDAILIDKGLVRGPKFLPLPQLLELWNTVDQRGQDFDERAGVELLLAKLDGWTCLARQLTGSGRAIMVDDANRREYVIEGGVVEGSGISRSTDAPIVITEYERGVASRRAKTARIDLFFDDEIAPGSPPRFDLAVSEPEVADLKSRETVRARWPQRITGIEVRGCAGRDWGTFGNEDAAQAASEPHEDSAGPVEDLTRQGLEAAQELRGAVRLLYLDIASHFVQRVAQSISAPLLLLLGAVLAMWRRQSLPLAIYLLSFVPAVANILLIASGQQLMRGGSAMLGASLIGGGTLLLILIAAFGFHRLARN